MMCRMIPQKREEYLALHRAVWPGVEATITACGIRNFTIFVRGDVLVGYFEYIGEDYEADQRVMAADPVTQEWWAHTSPCQVPFDDLDDAPAWQELEEAWHLD
ncbi:L-rhamnose mutarotase [Microbacterium sp. RURRCA19A]|uniref:L-rhamnose mutarotase n=1 Tax=Microbacterium sp. RURRCA19A TaxID=1907391 RepID=UPI0026DCB051|nr:L-rhamnose mutarotase [Microbacterium sp. RURRCA19A]